MADKTGIEWTDATWNPVTGCAKVSAGCKHCYAERDWARLSANPATRYHGRAFGDLQTHRDVLERPLSWRRPRRIFVNSMSDLFHEAVPVEFIAAVFGIMARCPQHTFQILTKRAERMQFVLWSELDWKPLPNIWLGVSVENQAAADERIPLLLETPAAVRWISAEPLLGPLDLRIDLGEHRLNVLTGHFSDDPPDWNSGPRLDWVVVGGESGPNARPMHPDWARSLRDQCAAASVPFIFKQWGESAPSDEMHRAGVIAGHQLHSFPWGPCGPQMAHVGKRLAGRLLDGIEHNGYPEVRS